MSRCSLIHGLAFVLLLMCAVGCNSEAPDNAAKQNEAGHTHDEGDALTWKLKEKLDDSDFEIWFGHHGDHFHGGESIESAIAITRATEAVADAKVFNQLVDSKDAAKMLSEEVATVYEPETDDEIAHYAQGDLVLPTGVSECLIRYRVVLPGQSKEVTRDVTVQIGH